MSQQIRCPQGCGQVVAARAIVAHVQRYCAKRNGGGYVPTANPIPTQERVARILDLAAGLRNRR